MREGNVSEKLVGARVQGRSPCIEAVGTVNTVKPRPVKHGRNALNVLLPQGKKKTMRFARRRRRECETKGAVKDEVHADR